MKLYLNWQGTALFIDYILKFWNSDEDEKENCKGKNAGENKRVS